VRGLRGRPEPASPAHGGVPRRVSASDPSARSPPNARLSVRIP
jgi:hypothetical protein